jgi:hypothetical protein
MSRGEISTPAFPERDRCPVRARLGVGTLLLCVALGTFLGAPSAFGAAMISVTGTWSLTLTAADLVVPNTAGYNLNSTYSSLVSGSGGPIVLGINAGGPGPTWTISVDKADVSWPTGVSLSVSISSPTSNPPILVNNSPVTLTASTQAFYQTNSTADVTIYYQLSGVTVVNLTATTYSTVVTYTIAEP